MMAMVPLLSIMIFSAWYTRSMAVREIVTIQERELSHNASTLAEDLEAIEEFIIFTAADNTNFSANANDMMARNRIYLFLNNAKIVFRYIDYISARTGSGILINSVKNDLIEPPQRVLIDAHSKASYEKKDNLSGWEQVKIGEEEYLCYHIFIGGVLFSEYTSIRHILSGLEKNPGIEYYFTDLTGGEVADTTEEELRRYILFPETGASTSVPLKMSAPVTDGLRLSAVIDKKTLAGRMDRFVTFIVLLSILSVLMLPFVYYLIRKWYVIPVMNMTEALQKFHFTGMQYRMLDTQKLKEFAVMQNSFNTMAEELSDSTARYIEESEKRQKAQLSMLQTKIHPHTFLNSLTTISNLAALDRKESLQQYIDLFSTHMRYMMGNGFHIIRLEEELWFVDNYINMQNIRSDHSIFLYRMLEESTLNCRITPFLVYTFVENSIKHAIPDGDCTDIFVNAAVKEKRLQIQIRDNGQGFAENKLIELNSMTTLSEDDTRHIGIKNMYRILELEYGDSFSLHFSNAQTGGAVVDIELPTQE